VRPRLKFMRRPAFNNALRIALVGWLVGVNGGCCGLVVMSACDSIGVFRTAMVCLPLAFASLGAWAARRTLPTNTTGDVDSIREYVRFHRYWHSLSRNLIWGEVLVAVLIGSITAGPHGVPWMLQGILLAIGASIAVHVWLFLAHRDITARVDEDYVH
jgi:hypothetical protein